MKRKSVILRWVLYGLILLVLVIPKLQAKFSFLKEKPLSGGFVATDYVKPSVKTWFNGEFQEQKEKYINESFGFRNTLVRLNNQIAFSLFDKAKANDVVIGKDNYLFEKRYIDGYYGRNSLGEDSVRIRMEMLRFIREQLKKMNKELLLVFAAGKASYYPEFIPEKFKSEKKPSNYELYAREAAISKIPFIDFNREFMELKSKVEVPLFPKYGIHWTEYSSVWVADSIMGRIGKLLHVPMDSIVIVKTDYKTASDQDLDVGNGMNLLFEFSEKQLHANVNWKRATGRKPAAVVVGDSFFWMPRAYGMETAFSRLQFWYYNKEVYTVGEPVGQVSAVNLTKAVAETDVFVLLSTEANLDKFGWGFIDSMYDHFKKHPVR